MEAGGPAVAQLVNLVPAVRSYDYVLEPSPVALPLAQPQQTRVVQVACGRAHSLVLTDQEGGWWPHTHTHTHLCDIQPRLYSAVQLQGLCCSSIKRPLQKNHLTATKKHQHASLMRCQPLLDLQRLHSDRLISVLPLTVFSFGNNAYGQCGRHIVEDEVYRCVKRVNIMV